LIPRAAIRAFVRLRTADQGQLDAPDDGIEVEMRYVKLLFQLGFGEVRPPVGRHICGLLKMGCSGGEVVMLKELQLQVVELQCA
jgi:hypothetical protein